MPPNDLRAGGEKVLVVVGPTAVGKSQAAARAASLLDGEIVSADSMQVYKGMNIGTAKPGPELLSLATHHLINLVEPGVEFSVAQYQPLARRAIADIHTRGRLPIVVGGSGLYVRAAIDPLDFPAVPPGSELRKQLESLADSDPDHLLARLKDLDPDAAGKIDPRNIRRVIRAVEAVQVRQFRYGQREELWRRRQAVYETMIIGLRLERNELNSLIDQRVDEMIAAGLETEVDGLASGQLSKTARQALGYKEFLTYLNGDLPRDEAIDLIKRRTRRFAKRQMTWFKADSRVNWLDVGGGDPDQIGARIADLVKTEGFIVT